MKTKSVWLWVLAGALCLFVCKSAVPVKPLVKPVPAPVPVRPAPKPEPKPKPKPCPH